jgi:NADPH-dependent 2,4-dienoyl-CoA reductase/sulfur reductase-like enzyme
VSVVEESDELGEGMNLYLKAKLIPWFEAKKVGLYPGAKYEEITPKGVTVTTKEGERKTLEADTVMIIERDRKNDALYKELEGRAPELYLIGDAREDKNAWLTGSVHEGARVGMAI